jgi:hypothetical protein
LLIQNQFDDEKQRNIDLQSKLNETSKQKIEIECQLNDMRKKESENIKSSTSSGRSNSPIVSTDSRDEIINDLKLKLSRNQTQLEDECKRNELSLKKLEEKIEQLSNLFWQTGKKKLKLEVYN